MLLREERGMVIGAQRPLRVGGIGWATLKVKT